MLLAVSFSGGLAIALGVAIVLYVVLRFVFRAFFRGGKLSIRKWIDDAEFAVSNTHKKSWNRSKVDAHWYAMDFTSGIEFRYESTVGKQFTTEVVIITYPRGTVLKLDFSNGALQFIDLNDEVLDETSQEYRSGKYGFLRVLNLVRSKLGEGAWDKPEEEPDEDHVDKSPEAIAQRRKAIDEKKAAKSGRKPDKNLKKLVDRRDVH